MTKNKKSAFAGLGAIAGFALAFRKSSQRQAKAAAALRPQGGAEAAERSKPSDGKQRAKAGSARGGNGHLADSPEQIPPRGWFEIAKRTGSKFSENELMSEAASVTFYALLSLFPAVTAIVSIYGLFADPAAIKSHLDSAAGFVPSGGLQIIDEQVKRLTQSPTSGLSVGAIVGILTALWSANQGSKAMLSALNRVYGEREGRGFIKLTAISLAFTVGGIIAMLASIGLVLVLPLVFKFVGLAGAFDTIMRVVRWPVVLAGIIAALALLYRFGPSRNQAKWRWVTWGGVLGAIFWVVLSFAFSWYVQNFGSYNKTYGSLGAIIGFMTWIWLSCTVLLLGAQINAEMEMQTVRDTTVSGGRPPGQRGAAAADAIAS